EPAGSPESVLNAKLVAGAVLPAGDYLIRVADDHYKDQLGNQRLCFPFSFDVLVVPESTNPPSVLSVNPLPSVPLIRGVDLVLTVRFSEPPKGSIEEVTSKFSLGGVQATTGGSMKKFESTYTSANRKAVVQTSVTEGEKVWVLAFSGQALTQMQNAPLELANLRGNASGQPFQFNPVTYTIVDAPKGTPWSGGEAGSQTAGGVSASAQSMAQHEDGEVHVEGSSAMPAESHVGEVGGLGAKPVSVDDGEIRSEGGLPVAPVSVSSGIQDPDLPKVEIWDPSAESGVTTSFRGGSKDAGVTGHGMVVLLSLGAVAVVGVLLMFPQLRKGEIPRNRRDRSRNAVPEEEIGLVSAGGFNQDDDML
ncbi:unnamed protein product, partial [Effrenium voratum]